MSLTERRINIPDKIIMSDGNTEKTIQFNETDPLEYLKLCVSMNFYQENGTI